MENPSSHNPRLSFSGGTLVFEGAARKAVFHTLAATPGAWDARVNAWRCDALHYPAVLRQLHKAGWDFDDCVPAWSQVRWPRAAIHPPRPEQRAAVEAWMKNRRGCVVMPTGTGKTEVALHVMAATAVSTLIVAPVRDLMYQWHRRILEGLGYDAGIVGDNVFHVRPVSVTTYDSACIHAERFGNQFGLMVFDECHHLPGEVRRDAARMSAAPMRLGLTATPERSDGRHVDLGELIGPIVYDMPIAAAKGRTLADYDVVRIPVHLSDEEQARYDRLSREVRAYVVERRKTDPQFQWEDLCRDTAGYVAQPPSAVPKPQHVARPPSAVMGHSARPRAAVPQQPRAAVPHAAEARRVLRAFREKKSIEDRAEEKLRVLEDLFRLHAHEPCLVFAGSNAMARDVSQRFLIPCLLNHCGKKERLDVLRGLEEGVYPALAANRVLDEGVDLPEVKVAIVIGGMASSRQAKQRLGRILRKSGNARAVLYEIVTADTNEERRSRARRKSDAYQGTRRRRL